MAKEKVTLTLSTAELQELRELVGARSLSATVDDAIRAYLAKLKHLAAVDEWLAELERDHGPVPPETLEWAAQIVDRWASNDADPVQTSRRAS
jgi:predicted transcriptional regulator